MSSDTTTATFDDRIVDAINRRDLAVYYKAGAKYGYQIRIDYGDGYESVVYESENMAGLESWLECDWLDKEHECERCGRYVVGSEFVELVDGPDLANDGFSYVADLDWRQMETGRNGFARMCEDCARDVIQTVQELEESGEIDDYVNLAQFDGEFVKSVW